MLLFIDESGDAGFKFDSGSSKYFVVALLVFEDHDEASAVDDRINVLKREIHLSDRSEFHFNKLKPDQRKTFLAAIAPYDFFYWAIVINKERLTSHHLEFHDSFYKYAFGLILENAKPRLSNAIVVIDGAGVKDFGKRLKTYLSRRLKDDLGRGLIQKLKTEDSTKNNLLQMADMIVGAIARSFNDKRDASEYRKIIAHREIEVEFWPK